MGQPLLARDVVRYVGEPLAVVVTESRYQGEDAGDLVDVDYDVLPPVVEAAEAAASETVLFPAAGSNVAASFGDAAALAADLFDGCEVVVSRTIVNQRVAPAPMETRAAAAVLRPGRQADGLDPEPGRAGDARGPGRHARHRRRPGCGSSPRTWAVRSGPSSAPTRSTRWSAGWPGGSAGPRAGPRPATRT